MFSNHKPLVEKTVYDLIHSLFSWNSNDTCPWISPLVWNNKFAGRISRSPKNDCFIPGVTAVKMLSSALLTDFFIKINNLIISSTFLVKASLIYRYFKVVAIAIDCGKICLFTILRKTEGENEYCHLKQYISKRWKEINILLTSVQVFL